jgi:gliding motility-associated-like protein
MKNPAALFILFFLYTSTTTAQALFSRMQYDWGGNLSEFTANMVPLPNKQYLFGGTSQSNPSCTKSSISYGSDDMALFVLDDQGQKIWEKSYGGSGSDRLLDVKKVPAGGFILVGLSDSGPSGIKKSPNFGSEDFWLVRVDDAGDLLWEKTFGSSKIEQGVKVIPTPDGGFLIAGKVYFTDSYYLVLKTDANGNQMWTTTFDGSNDDLLYDMQQMSDGNFLLLGTSNSPVSRDKTAPQIGGYDQWLICISPEGVKLWDKTYGTNADEEDCRITPLRDGNYLIAGNMRGSAGTLRKIDAQGNLIWTQSCSEGLFRMATQAANGNIYVAGESYLGITGCKTSALSGGNVDFWITVFDEAGKKIGDMDYGGMGMDQLISDIRIIDRDLWVLGITNSGISGNKTTPACGGIDGWIIRLGPGVNIVPPTPVALCNNTNTFSVEIATVGVYKPGNIFTVQLSDANGSFSSFTNIGSISGTSSTGIAVQIPAGYPASDNYKLRVVSSLYADTSNTYGLSWQDPPKVFLGNDTAICINTFLTLTAANKSTGARYLWNDGSTDSTLTVTTAGTYTCTVQNICGTAQGSTQIAFKTMPIADIGNDQHFCEGTSLTLQSTPQAVDVSYGWNNGATVPTITVKTSGDYWLHTSNACGTTGDTVHITMDPKPVTHFDKDSVLCYGSSRTFTADAGYAGYLWYDGLGGESRTVNTPGEYWVQVTGNNGCITRDTAAIKRIDPCGFFMPSAFSPNNDGKNERCHPQLLGRLIKYHFIVFNRWGQKVFDSYDPTNGWDGKINGRPAEAGAYVWSCLYQFINEEEKHAKGTVLLLR